MESVLYIASAKKHDRRALLRLSVHRNGLVSMKAPGSTNDTPINVDNRPALYRRFREAPYRKRLKALLEVKGGSLQKEFLDAVRDRRAFVDYMSALPADGTREVPLWQESISETDFRALPAELELSLYRQWAHIPADLARRSGFWGYVTTRHIEAGRIDSTHLTATNQMPRASAIDRAVAEDAPIKIDGCVRNALRRMGGLPPVRGHLSVFVDCMFGRAWWRERMVEEATSEVTNGVRALFRISGKSLWEELIARLIDKDGVSVFGPLEAPNEIRGVLFLALAQHHAEKSSSPLPELHQVRRVFQQIATYQETPGLGPAADLELARVVRALVANSERTP